MIFTSRKCCSSGEFIEEGSIASNFEGTRETQNPNFWRNDTTVEENEP